MKALLAVSVMDIYGYIRDYVRTNQKALDEERESIALELEADAGTLLLDAEKCLSQPAWSWKYSTLYERSIGFLQAAEKVRSRKGNQKKKD